MSTITKRYLLLSIILALAGFSAIGQNAPVTTAATVGGAVPGPVDVPLTVTGFNNIGAISLSIDYNYAVMQFTGATPNPELSSFPAGDLDLGTGYHRITMGWFGSGVTLANGSAIMTLHFTFTGGISTLTWYDSGPSCEYADGNYNVLNDIPTDTYYVNGYVCGTLGNPGAITGSTAVCEGATGVEYAVAPLVNATGYYWDVPSGAVITTGQNTNAITVDYPPGAVSGNVSVNGTNDCGSGPASVLPVTVEPLPIANAGTDFTINYGTSTTLHAASGGSGSYFYHWSPEALLVDPDVQDPMTVILTSTTLFTVLVTNQATGCQNSDEVVVTITGGPLTVNPSAVPPSICTGSYAQLFSNAGGGSGNYTYLWTSDPPGFTSTQANPFVSPDASTSYQLQVNDGFTVTTGTTDLAVYPLPTATLTGGDTLCGEGEFDTLTVDLTGTPPWSFTYSYGSTSVFVENQPTTPYYIITADPGDYVITALDDQHCAGMATGTAMVRKYPIPATPEITVYFSELISSSCCGNQWYRNDTLIPGATGQTYQVIVSGSYTVIVTMNSCSSAPSEPVDMIVGIAEHGDGDGISVYPNPAGDRVTIRFARPLDRTVNVCLSDLSGRTVGRYDGRRIEDCQWSNGNCQLEIDIDNLKPGIYIIIISADGIQTAGKLMIK